MTNKESHAILSTLNNLFDLYNRDDFSKVKEVNQLFLKYANEGLTLVKYLHEKEPCESTEMYLLYTGRLIMRLSHLIHNGTKEGPQDRADVLEIYRPKNNWKYIYLKDLQ